MQQLTKILILKLRVKQIFMVFNLDEVTKKVWLLTSKIQYKQLVCKLMLLQ